MAHLHFRIVDRSEFRLISLLIWLLRVRTVKNAPPPASHTLASLSKFQLSLLRLFSFATNLIIVSTATIRSIRSFLRRSWWDWWRWLTRGLQLFNTADLRFSDATARRNISAISEDWRLAFHYCPSFESSHRSNHCLRGSSRRRICVVGS